MAAKNKRKVGKYPIEVRKLKRGHSFRFRLPTELGGGWVNVGNTMKGCTYKDAVRAYESVMGDIARRKFNIRRLEPGAFFEDFAEAFLEDLRKRKDDVTREELFIKQLNQSFGKNR